MISDIYRREPRCYCLIEFKVCYCIIEKIANHWLNATKKNVSLFWMIAYGTYAFICVTSAILRNDIGSGAMVMIIFIHSTKKSALRVKKALTHTKINIP